MHPHRRSWLSALFAFVLVVSLISPLGMVGAQGAGAQQAPAVRLLPDGVRPPASRLDGVAVVSETSPEIALDKIDPALREQANAGGKDLISVYVSAKPEVDLAPFLQQMIARPVVFGGLRAVYGQIAAGDLLKVAGLDGVAAIVRVGDALRDKPYDAERADKADPVVDMARFDAARANQVTWSSVQARVAGDVSAQGWFDVLDGHKSKEAWKKGFEGQGVIVGVLDDGIDFAHPDLQGTYAVVTDESSPYYGWPMSFSQVSMLYFVQEVWYQDLGAKGITQGWNGSRWADTSTERTIHDPQGPVTGTVTYKPLGAGSAHEYLVPKTSLSGTYKLGSLPEKNLLGVFGERVAILVVDEETAGVYDTVYVDLDDDYDFSDEKPVTKESPEVYAYLDEDIYADISGGLLTWISDGENVPPTADWLWGITCGDEVGTLKACPASGSLLTFAGPFDAGYTHGTQCASNIAGQGRVSGGLTAQPFREGGMVQGAAPKVGLMDFGNHYYAGTDEDEFLVAALGYDGLPMSGDEVQITTNSYGTFTQMWGGWGYIGRLITALNTTIAPSTVWVFSAGNEGPGYGPQEGDSSPTTIQVGSSTQYGSTNWDSIASADQIVYGDVTSFFSKGPNRDGTSGLDVLANGGRGSGDEGLNYYGFNGVESWATWGGTSRSAPVAGGNLALIFQAYKARYGVWPTWDVAKALLKSGANDASGSPFYQGAGVVNADRSTDLAAGIYGAYATPDEWQVGDWEGTEYLNFAKVAVPGEEYQKEYTVTNPSGYPLTVSLSDGIMALMGRTELTFTTQPRAQESAFNFHSPDYLMKLDPALIPADAELMIVRYVHPYDTFDPVYDFTANPNSSWRFMVYNWTDQNGDGKLWVDKNGNGVVNHSDLNLWDNDGFKRLNFANSEIQEGEYVRMDYEFGGLAVPIFIHDPLARMADGYYFGWQHRYSSALVGPTTFKIGVEFYKRADWDWLSLSDASLFVPAEGTATFQAAMDIPADATPGAYEGVIYMGVPGDLFHAGYEVALPVVVNVIADLPDGGSVTFGGEPMDVTPYQNSWIHGYFNWYGGGWTGAGDWRHFFLNVDQADVDKGYLLIHTSWADGYPTDINTWVLGPTDDCASNGAGPCAWYEPGLGQPNEDVFGPYTLAPIAWTDPFMSGAAYPFHTTTGGPDDWLLVRVDRPGLYAIALHNVLYSGDELAAQFQVEVGTLEVHGDIVTGGGAVATDPVEFDVYQNSGAVALDFASTIPYDKLLATLAGGLEHEEFGPFTEFVPDNGQVFSPTDPDNVVASFVLARGDITKLTVDLDVPPAQDADLFLVRDNDLSGTVNAGDTIVGSSGNSAGEDERIVVTNPIAAQYLTVIAGYDIEPNAGVNMDWYYAIDYPGALAHDLSILLDTWPSIGQDTAGVWSSASYSTTVTAGTRTGGFSASVTNIPAGNTVDLFVTDSGNNVVGQATGLTTNGVVDVLPGAGEYRLENGAVYTIWVVGANVPTPDISVNLVVSERVLNLWLTPGSADVIVQAPATPAGVDPGEIVRVIINYDKPGWAVGDPPLTARLIAGPSVLPRAFDEMITINLVEEPGEPVWNPDNLYIDVRAASARGPSPARWSVGGLGISTALIAPSERVTFTVHIENLDALPSPELLADVWPLPQDYLETWNPGIRAYYGFPVVTGAAYGLILGTPTSWDYNGGIEWLGQLDPGEAVDLRYWVDMPANMPLNSDFTSGVDVYDLNACSKYSEEECIWYGWDMGGARYRQFNSAGSYKDSGMDEVLPGDYFAYTISLKNVGAQDKAVTVVDVMPAEIDFVSASVGNYDAGARKWTWSTTMVGNSQPKTALLQVRAHDGLPYGTLITNKAEIWDAGLTTKYATLTDVTMVGSGIDLTLDKVANKLVAAFNETIRYTITLRNAGTHMAHAVQMVDEATKYLDILPGTVWASKGTTCGPLFDAGEISWCGDVNAGETVTVRYDAKVNTFAHKYLALINAAEAQVSNPPIWLYDSAVTEILHMSKNWLPIIFLDAQPGLQPS